MRALCLLTILALAAPAAEAQNRVVLGGVPTNLHIDFSNVFWSQDISTPGAFYAVLPLSEVGAFMAFDPVVAMDFTFGAGSWLRCHMVATEWAYFATSPCAHQPGSSYTAPQSLLTTDYDFGPYTGVQGAPHTPLVYWTRFGRHPQAYLQGLDSSWNREHWQLRTRGWDATDEWNGCGPSPGSVTPTFSGWIAVRFTVAFR